MKTLEHGYLREYAGSDSDGRHMKHISGDVKRDLESQVPGDPRVGPSGLWGSRFTKIG